MSPGPDPAAVPSEPPARTGPDPAAVPSQPPAGAEPLLEIRHLDVHYGRVQAIRDVSLTIHPGEIIALIGSNGAGKTTTVRAVSGLVRPSAGSILYRGDPIHELGAEKIARLHIGHAPEGRRLFSRMTVRENLEMGAFSRRDRAGVRSDFDRVYTLFPRLAERRTQVAGSLSGGEQQMVAIGRALMGRPSLLLLDEPSLGIAPILIEAIFRAIREVNAEGTTVMLIEQNAHLALTTADRAYVLETGSVVREGTASELLDSPDVQRAYLGM